MDIRKFAIDCADGPANEVRLRVVAYTSSYGSLVSTTMGWGEAITEPSRVELSDIR